LEVPTKIDYKYDGDKVRMELLPMDALYEVAKVLTKGAKKYADHSWKTLNNATERYQGALLRHITASMNGEDKDPESGLSHYAHLACNALFLLWLDMHKN